MSSATNFALHLKIEKKNLLFSGSGSKFFPSKVATMSEGFQILDRKLLVYKTMTPSGKWH